MVYRLEDIWLKENFMKKFTRIANVQFYINLFDKLSKKKLDTKGDNSLSRRGDNFLNIL
jgi:hypothetical protein